MEVHHHPHVEKKSFKEYLLEGLMIFLAVSLGFIAENIRERISEHEIEKRNMEIIVDNLKDDTTALIKTIKNSTERIQILDSLVALQNKSLTDTNVRKTFYNLFIKSTSIPLFQTNNAAFEQMKTSGSLRLIKQKKVLDSLFNYINENKIIDYNYAIVTENSKLVVEDAANFINFNNAINGSSNIEYKQKDSELFRFYNHCVSLRIRTSIALVSRLNHQLGNAKRLIQLLKTEHNID